MPAIEITDSKGLVQKTGSGITVESKGLIGAVQADTSLATTVDTDYNGSLSLPAGALIQDVLIICTDSLQTADTNNNDEIEFRMGTDSDGSGVQIIALTNIVERNCTVPVGAMTSVSAGNILLGTCIAPAFATAAPLHSSAARTIHFRFRVDNTALVAAGALKLVVLYSIV